MSKARKWAFGLVVLVAFSAGRAHAAESPNCGLTRYAELPIITEPDGRISIPVTIAGQEMSFMIDTGGVSATMTAQRAKDLNLSIKPTNRWLSGVGGSLLNTYVRPDSFSIGKLKGEGLPIYLDPRISGLGVDGTLSPDMMKNFDVDIDFAQGKVNFFSQDHCPGKVVYWTNSGHIVVPMQVAVNSGHIRIPVTVDGKSVMATIDTGAVTSVMSLNVAKSLGIAEDSPDLKLLESSGSSQQYKIYSYPFKTLGLDGVTVNAPQIKVMSNEYLKGFDDLILGVGILRQLHIYIAYGEEKLYITPALAN